MVSEPAPPDVYVRSSVGSGSTPDETFRGVLRGHTVQHGSATVIVTRQGLGTAARIWLTFDGAIKTTVVMTDAETTALRELLGRAAASRAK
jgi:hypothetical protein